MASDRNDTGEEIPDADLLEHHQPNLDRAASKTRQHGAEPLTADDDRLLDAVVRVYADYAEHDVTLAEVLTLFDRCRSDLDHVHPEALPEMVERLARQRLTDHPAQ